MLRGSTLTYYTAPPGMKKHSEEKTAVEAGAPTTEKTVAAKPTKAKKKGVIPLLSLRVSLHSHHTRQFVFALTHHEDKARTYFLSCESEEERVQWMNLLQTASSLLSSHPGDCDGGELVLA